MDTTITLTVDGQAREVVVDTRTTVLDALRERLGVTSPKKGCDHGQCGSCTVLLDGRRHLTCLALAASYDGSEVVTAAGLAGLAAGLVHDGHTRADGPEEQDLHPVQEAFLAHDGYQCGYCTPGQVCSAVGMLDEVRRGEASHVTADLRADTCVGDGESSGAALSDDEIRERMSGNLCRCGAYRGILDAVREAAGVSR